MITIGIATYNGGWRLANLLKSLSMRTPELLTGEAHVAVVDDGSPTVEQTRRVIEQWKGKMPLDYIEHGTNRGISAGWNTAARARTCQYVVEVNDDVIVSMGWLASVLHPLKHCPQVGVVGQSYHSFIADDVAKLLESPDSDSQVVPRDLDPNRTPSPGRRATYEDTNPGRVMCPTGQLFAFRREDFDAIGGFDENYKSFYEESDFGTSMAARGKIGVQVNWPFNWHMWSQTFSTNPELRATERMNESKAYYRKKWNVPDNVGEFEYTNPKYFGVIGDVEIEFLRKDGSVTRGVLRQDGAFVGRP